MGAGGGSKAAHSGAGVVKCAQGGSDFDLDRLVALCPPCHAQTDAPYARGRLVITPLGEGRFTCEVTRGADKWAIRAEGPNHPPAIPEWARLKEARMNKLSPELVRHVLRPAMHQKLLLRAAELVEQG